MQWMGEEAYTNILCWGGTRGECSRDKEKTECNPWCCLHDNNKVYYALSKQPTTINNVKLNPFFSLKFQLWTLKYELNLKTWSLVLQFQLQQISLALYSRSLDIRPAKPLQQGLPASRTSRPVQATAAMRSLSTEFKTTTLQKVHCSPTDLKLNKLCNPTPLTLKPVWVTAIPRQSHRVAPTRVCFAMQCNGITQYIWSSLFTPNVRSALGVGNGGSGEIGGFGLSKQSHAAAGHCVVFHDCR